MGEAKGIYVFKNCGPSESRSLSSGLVPPVNTKARQILDDVFIYCVKLAVALQETPRESNPITNISRRLQRPAHRLTPTGPPRPLSLRRFDDVRHLLNVLAIWPELIPVPRYRCFGPFLCSPGAERDKRYIFIIKSPAQVNIEGEKTHSE